MMFDLRIKKRLFGILVIGYLVCIGLTWVSEKDGSVHVYFLDVGQGDAIVIKTQEHTLMVDGGGDRFMDDDCNKGKTVIYPFLLDKGIRRIDCVFVSHSHYDHIKGILELIPLIPVGKVVMSKPYEEVFKELGIKNDGPSHGEHGQAENSDSNDKERGESDGMNITERVFRGGDEQFLLIELKALCETHGIPVEFMEFGQQLEFGYNVTMTCLYPGPNATYSEDENNNSLVLDMEAYGFDLLLTGDVEEEGEKWMLENIIGLNEIEMLKVAHHGSNSSSSEAFLSCVMPRFAVVCVGKNLFGHPSDIIRFRYKSLNIPFYTTKKYGMIEVIIDEGRYRIVPYKGELEDEASQRTTEEPRVYRDISFYR